MEETEPVSAKESLPEGAISYLEALANLYGPDAIAQGLRDIFANKAQRRGVDLTRLTAEERREARLWGFAKNDAECFLQKLLDHGPGSGCQ